MSDDESFLVGICQNPHDDVARLVYADWHEERGQAERAEFIRLQIELANLGVNPDGSVTTGDKESDEREKAIRRRCRWLLGFGRGHASLQEMNWYKWSGLALESIMSKWNKHDAITSMFRRGFVSHLECTLFKFMDWKCDHCDGMTYTQTDTGGNFWQAPCSRCRGNGTLPGFARTLFKLNPITEVVLTDKRPWDATRLAVDFVGEREVWRWMLKRPDKDDRADQLPIEIYNEMIDMADRESLSYLEFDSRESAMQALSLACVNYARSLHGYAPLVRTNRPGK